MCDSASRADTFVPVIVSEAFCACKKCLRFKFDEFLVKTRVIHVKRVHVLRQKGEKADVTKVLALPAIVAGVMETSTWSLTAVED